MKKRMRLFGIAFSLFAMFYLIGAKRVTGECNTDCRHHTVFYIDEGDGGIVCRQYATADCYYCTVMGRCDDSIPKSLNSHCDDDPSQIQKARNVTKCKLQCDLYKGQGAHATVQNPAGQFQNVGYVYHCQ